MATSDLVKLYVVTNTLWAALPVVLAVLALRPVKTAEVTRFADRYDLGVTRETYPAIAHAVRRGRRGRLAGAAIGLCVYPVLSALVSIRLVVTRPQPLTTPALVAVDDAIRTQAVHTLAGAGIAIASLGTASCLFLMAGSAPFAWLRIAGIVAGIVALGGALSAWNFRSAAWSVPRAMLR
jgi:hypothetical protein